MTTETVEPSASEENGKSTKQDLTTYTCERCGFKYEKVFDYPPYLCYRCIRFIAKRVFTIMNTIQPTTSRAENPNDV